MQPVAQHLTGLMKIPYDLLCCGGCMSFYNLLWCAQREWGGLKPLQKYEIEQIRSIFEIKWGQTPTFYCFGGILFSEGA